MEQQDVTKKLGMCEVCGTESAKYTCPRCSQHTCSLACVRCHKDSTGCSGQRDKTAFVAKGDFTKTNLLSDLHFLEELKRDVDQFRKGRETGGGGKQDHSARIKALKVNAKHRGVYILFMPRGMGRHDQNTTMFDAESGTIHWRIEWKFPQENITFIDDRVPDTESIQSCIDRHAKEHQKQMSGQTAAAGDALKTYTEEGDGEYCVLFKIYGKAKFCEVDRAKSLYEGLAGKSVVEFPTLYVVRKDLAHAYPILSAEEEVSEMGARRQQNVMSLRMAREGRGRGHGNRFRGRGQGRGRGRGHHRGRGGRGGRGGGAAE